METNRNAEVRVKQAGGTKITASKLEKPKSEEARRGFDLHAYRNRKRVIIVFAPSADDSRFVRQQEMFANSKEGFTERDLVRLDVFETGQSRAESKPISGEAVALLREQFGAKPGAFRAVLIGKDGHTAYSTARPLSATNLFGLIDAMPMRREEMNREVTKRK